MEKQYEGTEWTEWVARQQKNLTMDRKLFITVCPVGGTFSRMQNPHLPRTPKEIAQDVIAAYKEGACLAHLHTRDLKTGRPSTRTDLLKETIDTIRAECPDIIIQPSAAEGYRPEAGQYTYETMKPMVEALHELGRGYMESTIFTPISYAQGTIIDGFVTVTKESVTLATEENAVNTIRFLQENRIKPELMCHNWEGILNVKEWLIKPRILEKPYFLSMGPGMHNAAETYPDPWGYLYLTGMMNMMPEDTITGVSIGGRNWLAISTFAILLGVDFVRVGMEDHLWMYPHRDEIIQHSADEARKIATIAHELGREVGSVNEARSLLRLD